jgi:hypothetical protein
MFTFNPYAFIDIKNKICHLAILNTEAIYFFFLEKIYLFDRLRYFLTQSAESTKTPNVRPFRIRS